MSTSVKINAELYTQLKDFAYKKHKSFKCVKTELDKAVQEYLAKQKNHEDDVK